MFDRSQGYIIIHRKILEWEWYDDANTMRVFFHILISVNHKPKNWRGLKIGRGQGVLTHEAIAKKLKLSVRNVRTSIMKLKSTGELTVKNYPKFGLYTVKNYMAYQPTDRHSVTQLTGKRQASDRQVTTNNNEDNEYNENNEREDTRTRDFENFVQLSVEERKALNQKYGRGAVDKMVDRLENYMLSSGKKYKSHYRTLLIWFQRQKDEGKLKLDFSDFSEEDFDSQAEYQARINKII